MVDVRQSYLGYLCQYKLDLQRPWTAENVASLVILDCSSIEDIRIVSTHPGFRYVVKVVPDDRVI